jgi:lysophosphatidylglycerol acyltransferase 1
VVEVGDDVSRILDQTTLVIANHQSTADVPLLMTCFNAKEGVLDNLMWIMDKVFKYTNFGIVSYFHEDFFILSV